MQVGGEAHLVKCRMGQRDASQEVMRIQRGDEGTVLGTAPGSQGLSSLSLPLCHSKGLRQSTQGQWASEGGVLMAKKHGLEFAPGGLKSS